MKTRILIDANILITLVNETSSATKERVIDIIEEKLNSIIILKHIFKEVFDNDESLINKLEEDNKRLYNLCKKSKEENSTFSDEIVGFSLKTTYPMIVNELENTIQQKNEGSPIRKTIISDADVFLASAPYSGNESEEYIIISDENMQSDPLKYNYVKNKAKIPSQSEYYARKLDKPAAKCKQINHSIAKLLDILESI